ncbi:MAG: c-type cytochrome [Actinobacteria bacterium]|nr:c-type cytochrome [Actinomycetota bacterium]
MNVKPSSMPLVAAGLAVLVAIVGVALWTSPWEEDATGGAAGGPAASSEVKYDEKLAGSGKSLAESNGCTSCHTIDGGSGAGPTWAGLWGAQGAKGGKVDTAYIVDILENPPAAMASYKGKFSEADSKAIAEYVKSLAQ